LIFSQNCSYYKFIISASGNGCQDTVTTTAYVTGHGDDPPIVQLVHPTGGEMLSGTVTVEWFAISSDGLKDIYLFYSGNNGATWRQIGEDLYNNFDIEHGNYQWNTGSLGDDQYMLKIEVFDYDNNIAMDTSDLFTIDNGNAGVRIADVHIMNTDTDSTQWVKNGDTLEVTAGITGHGASVLGCANITADLSGFGMETSVEATSFDGFTATWTLNNVECTPSDGLITVTVTLDNLYSNSGTITADNTAPELTIDKPNGGLYLFNFRFLPFGKTTVIGPLNVMITADDTSVAKAEFSVDGVLLETVQDDPFDWRMNVKTMGQHTLEVMVFDSAGNTVTQSQEVTIYNPFGTDW